MKNVLIGGAATAALVTVPHLFLVVGAIGFTGVAAARLFGKASSQPNFRG